MVKNLKDLMTRFKDEATCREYLIQQRWDGVPTCPYCSYKRSYFIENGKRFKCANKECYKKYSVTVGTIFEASNIPLTTWFAAMYLITAHKKGISSVQLAKDLGITQKSAWFVLHRIRESLKVTNPEVLTGIVEIDEAYMGRKYASDYKAMPPEEVEAFLSKRSNTSDKGALVGMIQRGGDAIVNAVSARTAENVHDSVKKHVSKDVRLMTDEALLYRKTLKEYNRETVNHSKGQWVVGDVYTNNIENFWSVMKRTVYGTYHQISFKHLQRYCDECTYRYNSRKLTDGFRFQLAMMGVEGRLKYLTLVNGQESSKKETAPETKA